jgi:radical SAM protein with 4Fe4S-binding SPASM domain
MCGQWGDQGVTRQDGVDAVAASLDENDIAKVLQDLKGAKPSVTLFGGEPFLHPKICDIIRRIKDFGLHTLIITNGTLLEKYAEEIVRLGVDEINISIDGDEALHDEIRGLPGVFGRIMNGIERVNAAKSASGKTRPLINLQCTISRFNAEHLERLVPVAARAKANSLTFHNLIFLPPGLIQEQKRVDEELRCSSRNWEGFVFEAGIDPVRLAAKIREVLHRPHNFSVDFYPNFSEKGLAEYYLKPDYLPSEYAPRCLSPWVCAYVFPDGEVRPCLNCSYSFGNVRKKSFFDIWNSPEARRYRLKLKQEGIFPACRRCTELYRY